MWLKQWDSCVFGYEIRSTTEEVLSALRRHSSIAQHQRPSGMSFLRKNKGQRLSDGNSRYSNNLDQENGNLKGLQELWNKKSRGSSRTKGLLLYLFCKTIIYLFIYFFFVVDRCLVCLSLQIICMQIHFCLKFANLLILKCLTNALHILVRSNKKLILE